MQESSQEGAHHGSNPVDHDVFIERVPFAIESECRGHDGIEIAACRVQGGQHQESCEYGIDPRGGSLAPRARLKGHKAADERDQALNHGTINVWNGERGLAPFGVQCRVLSGQVPAPNAIGIAIRMTNKEIVMLKIHSRPSVKGETY